ncbi:hypothetical protein FTUN_8741 [Frigoriglobus tundricola]|uniref:Uncharacterized protein n=1 Tax=Frigoriglobus tundricola TaxID=2774151 RepID=A0A6M5Z693_9BACT|nr:hypothetical protein FTUN_8741 [Frigoriglobus tundricola]
MTAPFGPHHLPASSPPPRSHAPENRTTFGPRRAGGRSNLGSGTRPGRRVLCRGVRRRTGDGAAPNRGPCGRSSSPRTATARVFRRAGDRGSARPTENPGPPPDGKPTPPAAELFSRTARGSICCEVAVREQRASHFGRNRRRVRRTRGVRPAPGDLVSAPATQPPPPPGLPRRRRSPVRGAHPRLAPRPAAARGRASVGPSFRARGNRVRRRIVPFGRDCILRNLPCEPTSRPRLLPTVSFLSPPRRTVRCPWHRRGRGPFPADRAASPSWCTERRPRRG